LPALQGLGDLAHCFSVCYAICSSDIHTCTEERCLALGRLPEHLALIETPLRRGAALDMGVCRVTHIYSYTKPCPVAAIELKIELCIGVAIPGASICITWYLIDDFILTYRLMETNSMQ
jgi:hypothetical protein